MKLVFLLISFTCFSQQLKQYYKSSFINQFRTDLALNYIGGAGISATTFHYTKKVLPKPVARVIGVIVASGMGYTYERIKNDRVSKQNFLYSFYGAVSIQIPIGRKKPK